MTLPNFSNLDLFVKKANTGISPSVSVTREEAQHIAKEYLNLVSYTLDLQDKVISLQQEIAQPENVEIVAPNF